MNTKTISAIVALIIIAGGAYYWTQTGASDNAQAGSLEINFGNNSYDTLGSIELSPAGQGSYQAIPLENGALGAGEFFKYAIPDGQATCRYDLRVTKENGAVSDRPDVDLCAATFYHFEDDA